MHSATMFNKNETFDFADGTKVEIQTEKTLKVQIKDETFCFSEDNKAVFPNQSGEKVVEYHGLTTDENATRSFAKASFEPGGFSDAHHHNHLTEDYYILSGKGDIYIDGVTHQVSAGDYIQIKPGKVHEVINSSENQSLQILVVCNPAWSVKDFNPVLHCEQQAKPNLHRDNYIK